MLENSVEFLLIEDNPVDVELALHAFERHYLANRIQVLRDGVEALDYLFCTGEYEGRKPGYPKAILLDLRLPRIDGLEVLRRAHAPDSGRGAHQFEPGPGYREQLPVGSEQLYRKAGGF